MKNFFHSILTISLACGVFIMGNNQLYGISKFKKHATAHAAKQDFFRAAAHNNVRKILQFLRAGIKVNMRDKEGYTALMHAVSKGCVGTTQILINAHTNLTICDKEGNNALMLAIGNEEVPHKIIRMLITAFTNEHLRYIDWVTSAWDESPVEITSYVIAPFIPHLDDQNNEGKSALILAVEESDLATVKLLLQHNVNLDLQDTNGWTALMHAVFRTEEDFPATRKITQMLVEYGADRELLNDQGKTVGDMTDDDTLLYSEDELRI